MLVKIQKSDWLENGEKEAGNCQGFCLMCCVIKNKGGW
jgi:hypothetical protein